MMAVPDLRHHAQVDPEGVTVETLHRNRFLEHIHMRLHGHPEE